MREDRALDVEHDDDRWDAVRRRDGSADGTLYYAVRSTGVYCRPSCPSRRPRREHVVFFDSHLEAEAAGYRPCQRCHPNAVHRHHALAAAVQRILDTRDPKPTLAELAREVGLSPSHVQRVFKRVTGLSPKQYVKAARAAQLERSLKTAGTVADAQYDAGYDSSHALYRDVGSTLGMTPGRFGRGGEGELIEYGVFDSPLGRLLVAATRRGVTSVAFGDDEVLARELASSFPRAALKRDPDAVRHHVAAIRRFLEGHGRSLRLPLDIGATEFQRRVWSALQRIPCGETRTYQEIAAAIGQPHASRAVARACAMNPVALAIPCHRVIRTGGSLSGFRWGTHRKAALLERDRNVSGE
jgi:AraC family transcriptional regulator, regulatory protein of adaptative response / methylated-DNA-[protein]-cysteine methyltransferase